MALDTNLDQDWAYFNLALINDTTGDAYDFGREVSYYHDSDGSEGSPKSSILIPAVAPGTYQVVARLAAKYSDPVNLVIQT